MGAICSRGKNNQEVERRSGHKKSPNTLNGTNAERTTRISVGGSEYSFDVPSERSNGIIIINHTPAEKTRSVETDRKILNRDGIFTCRYTAASFQDYARGKYSAFPAGNFIDCRNIPVRSFVSTLHVLSRCSHSVCQIRFGNCSATGFRVGRRYIMTAFHAVKEIIRKFTVRGTGHLEYNAQVAALAHRNVFCLFDYFEGNQYGNVRKYFFKALIHFCNEETDTAILELDVNPNTAELPPPFQEFGFPDYEGRFTFLGHEGSAMEYNMVDMIINKDDERTKADIQYIKGCNDRITDNGYDFPPHNILTNEHRLLFHCKFGNLAVQGS